VWTGHAGETSRQGSNAGPCEIDDDYRKHANQGIVNNDFNICGGWEDRVPYNDDQASAAGNDNDNSWFSDGAQRCLSLSPRHFHKQQPSLCLGPIWSSVHDCR
jgi:hypothetical protein